MHYLYLCEGGKESESEPSEITCFPLLISIVQIMQVWFFITSICFIGVNTTVLFLRHSNAEEMSGSITARLAHEGEITCMRQGETGRVSGRNIKSNEEKRKMI